MIKAMMMVLQADKDELERLKCQKHSTLGDYERMVTLKERILKLEDMIDENVNEKR